MLQMYRLGDNVFLDQAEDVPLSSRNMPSASATEQGVTSRRGIACFANKQDSEFQLPSRFAYAIECIDLELGDEGEVVHKAENI